MQGTSGEHPMIAKRWYWLACVPWREGLPAHRHLQSIMRAAPSNSWVVCCASARRPCECHLSHKTYWEWSTVQVLTERSHHGRWSMLQLILRAPNYRFGRRMPAYSGGVLLHLYTPPRAAHVSWSCATQVQRACMLSTYLETHQWQ